MTSFGVARNSSVMIWAAVALLFSAMPAPLVAGWGEDMCNTEPLMDMTYKAMDDQTHLSGACLRIDDINGCGPEVLFSCETDEGVRVRVVPPRNSRYGTVGIDGVVMLKHMPKDPSCVGAIFRVAYLYQELQLGGTSEFAKIIGSNNGYGIMEAIYVPHACHAFDGDKGTFHMGSKVTNQNVAAVLTVSPSEEHADDLYRHFNGWIQLDDERYGKTRDWLVVLACPPPPPPTTTTTTTTPPHYPPTTTTPPHYPPITTTPCPPEQHYHHYYHEFMKKAKKVKKAKKAKKGTESGGGSEPMTGGYGYGGAGSKSEGNGSEGSSHPDEDGHETSGGHHHHHHHHHHHRRHHRRYTKKFRKVTKFRKNKKGGIRKVTRERHVVKGMKKNTTNHHGHHH